MSTALQLYDEPKSIASIGAQRTAIANLMSAVMKINIDYGTVPGTPKPSLYKPGSEKLLSMFHLAAQPVVEDLSTADCMRYRVFVKITEMGSGRYLGEGVGEASSAETKYQWRGVVCKEEWEMTPEDRRRTIWKKGQQPYPVQQVRTSMEDVANTVLKMAKKRAQIDAVLTVTAASDVFMQDAQEIVDAGIDVGDDRAAAPLPPATLQPKQGASGNKPAPVAQHPPSRGAGGELISAAQASRFYGIAKSTGFTNDQIGDYLKSFGITRQAELTKDRYEEACAWAGGA